jgi:UDP-N-acetylmuramoylalanine--D-glutamate ligase
MTTATKMVSEAYKNSPKGGVILLSPGSASFGMFKDYKDRGNQFKKEVLALS